MSTFVVASTLVETEDAMSVTMHREAVKAEIRIRFGSLEGFALANGLKSQSVRDLLRGQSDRAKPAVARLLGIDADQLTITDGSTDVESSSTGTAALHRQNAGGR